MNETTVPSSTTAVQPDPSAGGAQVRPWVRLSARLIDLSLYGIAAGIILAVYLSTRPPLDPNFAPARKLMGSILLLLSYVFVESWMLSTWGTTPGKKFFKVSLETNTGEKPTYNEALRRSWLVYVHGFCLGLPFVNIVAGIAAYFTLKKKGITTWDQRLNFRIVHDRIGETRIVIAVIYFIFLAYSISGV